MALNLAFRHYYTEVTYDRFFTLDTDGVLTPEHSYPEEHHATYNSWNIDLRFSWWFAPGSQLSLLYRNAMESYAEMADMSFRNNFDFLFAQPELHSFSLRVSYYLDFNRMKNWFGKKPETPSYSRPVSYREYKNAGSYRK